MKLEVVVLRSRLFSKTFNLLYDGVLCKLWVLLYLQREDVKYIGKIIVESLGSFFKYIYVNKMGNVMNVTNLKNVVQELLNFCFINTHFEYVCRNTFCQIHSFSLFD